MLDTTTHTSEAAAAADTIRLLDLVAAYGTVSDAAGHADRADRDRAERLAADHDIGGDELDDRDVLAVPDPVASRSTPMGQRPTGPTGMAPDGRSGLDTSGPHVETRLSDTGRPSASRSAGTAAAARPTWSELHHSPTSCGISRTAPE